jgi:hypothetical protein
MKAYQKLYYRSGVSSIFAAEENVAPLYWGFVMNTPLKDIVSLKASQLHESGIISHMFKAAFMKDFESKPEAIGLQVLTLQHLEAGFVVIFCLLVLSIPVFAVEIAPKLWKKLFA